MTNEVVKGWIGNIYFQENTLSDSGHEKMNIFLRAQHELSFASGTNVCQPEVVVLRVENGAGHVAVRPALPVKEG